nr:hypothetical protein [Shewanella xiamenensis]
MIGEHTFTAVCIADAEIAFYGSMLVFFDLTGCSMVVDLGAIVGACERNRQVLRAAGPSAVGHCDWDGERLSLALG